MFLYTGLFLEAYKLYTMTARPDLRHRWQPLPVSGCDLHNRSNVVYSGESMSLGLRMWLLMALL